MARETQVDHNALPGSGAERRVHLALGGNLPLSEGGSARETLEAAVDRLRREPLRIVAVSRWYESAPVPPSGQPWFVNGVLAADTTLPAAELMERLHAVEAEFGRLRSVPNAARTLDLDLIDYAGAVRNGPDDWPVLPHPRAGARAFVLLPLREVAEAGWRHPVTGETLDSLIAALPADQICRPIAG